MKGISVIIPTLNRSDFLMNTLNDLIVQKFDLPFEILIIDQSVVINKKIMNFCEPHTYINYHYITFFKGLPEARNYGASKAKYSILLFLDDDIECASDLLYSHYETFQKNNIAVVAGGITEKFKANKMSKIGYFNKWTGQALRGFHQKGNLEVDHAGGGNFSVKKEVYDEVGGIDENLTEGAALFEETDFCLRVKNKGYIIYFNHEAHMYHLAAVTGGCRVEEIYKYIYSLSRNKTIITNRYLNFLYKISAKTYLFKLIISYSIAYKSLSIIKAYSEGVKEGKMIALEKIKRSYA